MTFPKTLDSVTRWVWVWVTQGVDEDVKQVQRLRLLALPQLLLLGDQGANTFLQASQAEIEVFVALQERELLEEWVGHPKWIVCLAQVDANGLGEVIGLPTQALEVSSEHSDSQDIQLERKQTEQKKGKWVCLSETKTQDTSSRPMTKNQLP